MGAAAKLGAVLRVSMTFLPDSFGPTHSVSKGCAQQWRHSNDINRSKRNSLINQENNRMAARLQKLRGKKLPASSKRKPRRKPGDSGHGSRVNYDSGLSMEQEWRRYQSSTALDARVSGMFAQEAARLTEGGLLSEKIELEEEEYRQEAEQLSQKEAEVRGRLIEQQRKA